MVSHNEKTNSAKEDLQEIKKDIESLLKRLGHLKDKSKSGDIASEQLDHLADALTDLKNKGEKKGKEALDELSTSTQKHPLRNLTWAFGAGIVLSLILRK